MVKQFKHLYVDRCFFSFLFFLSLFLSRSFDSILIPRENSFNTPPSSSAKKKEFQGNAMIKFITWRYDDDGGLINFKKIEIGRIL